jgi:hypothetical protein
VTVLLLLAPALLLALLLALALAGRAPPVVVA